MQTSTASATVLSRRINYDDTRGMRVRSYSKIVEGLRLFLVSYRLYLVQTASSSRSTEGSERSSEARDVQLLNALLYTRELDVLCVTHHQRVPDLG